MRFEKTILRILRTRENNNSFYFAICLRRKTLSAAKTWNITNNNWRTRLSGGTFYSGIESRESASAAESFHVYSAQQPSSCSLHKLIFSPTVLENSTSLFMREEWEMVEAVFKDRLSFFLSFFFFLQRTFALNLIQAPFRVRSRVCKENVEIRKIPHTINFWILRDARVTRR